MNAPRLPAGPFAIQLGPDDPPSGVPEERTLVAVDLSTPGAVASAEQVGPDPELLSESGQQPPATSGDIIEPGYPWRYVIGTHCGVGVLGQLNGLWWMTDEGADVLDYVPDAWMPLVEAEELVVDVLMTEGPAPTLTATAAGYSVIYHPVPFADVRLCD